MLCALGFFISPGNLFRAWLTAYLVFLGIALGSMAMVMIQHLSGGSWGVFRRMFEASSRTLPLLALLFLPVVLGMGSLFVWTHPDHVQADEILRHKAPYLNIPFFLVRALIYFASVDPAGVDADPLVVTPGRRRHEREHEAAAPQRRGARDLRA